MTIYALVDCNNFYASCERVFNPLLENKPVAILSNNDGCIIARSEEVKALDIPMGAPLYQYQSLLMKHQVHVLSSNYALYGDMSQRVMEILKMWSPDVEVYSIDEAFLKLDGLEHWDLEKYAWSIQKIIKQWTGLPVSIGIAPTKTLAKLANHYAKKKHLYVCDLREVTLRGKVLSELATSAVWGIGRQLTEKLKKLDICNAQQLQKSSPKQMRKHFGVTVERTILELNGIACVETKGEEAKKNIIASRSFGTPVRDLHQLAEAINSHIARACVRLRKQRSKAGGIIIFIQSSHHQKDFYTNSETILLPYPTSDTRVFMQQVKQKLQKIYLPGIYYKKAGVILMDIAPDTFRQNDLFFSDPSAQNTTRLMVMLDKINQQMGKNTLFWAAQGIKRLWEMRSDNKSPSYTTDWKNIPTAFT